MPTPQTATQIRLSNVSICMGIALDSLEILANFNTPFLEAIANTTRSLLECVQTVKQNKETCTQLLEQTYELLNAIILVHMKSETGGDLPLLIVRHIGRFTETLHKIHTFVETQQGGSKVKKFLRQRESNALLKDCKNGLEQGFKLFEIRNVNLMTDIVKMRQDAEQKHKEVLDMIAGLADTASSDRPSTVQDIDDLSQAMLTLPKASRMYSGSYTSSNSISMLPSEPKIFHGRDLELSAILELFGQGTPRIAILGAGGMGKTSLARVVVHHAEISVKYAQHRYFVACDSATNKTELAALIGAHLGLKSGKDLTQAVFQYFTTCPSSLLVLDNLETVWEPTECRSDIEEFLSLVTDIQHLALVITMRGAERPSKVHWT
ncbi:ATPase-AAA-core domain-containing protein [Mycena venus]|uniref:ATPase-AAA-core domain-containing protein n=1 Tax=Mycena venus TaxID=2733690 RepID=A0A8H6XPX4_9AGAR|nr:ATPase-AAA-core domain-containing protein [Mycena venus]